MDLLQLQNVMKRAPQTYHEEFHQQMHNFYSQLTLFQIQDSNMAANKEQVHLFCNLITFLSHVVPSYKKEQVAQKFPKDLLGMLEQYHEMLDPALRRTIAMGLTLLQNRGMVDRLELLPLFFKLFKCNDKALRHDLFEHIVHDLKRVNMKGTNLKVNTTMQNFMYKMLKADSELAARKSLEVMIELWRRKVWNDDKTVHAISSACFSQHKKLLPISLNFFLGVTYYDEEEIEKNAEITEMKVRQITMDARVIKATKRRAKKERAVERALASARKYRDKDVDDMEGSFQAIDLIYDPQAFAERLFAKVKQSHEAFNIRLLMLNVISRLIGTHSLTGMENFYPFLQKYIVPSQQKVTNILAYLAQATHKLVPPDVIRPCVDALANHFVSDKSAPEMMAVGINAIKEICIRCPLVMDEDLLQDLVAYKTFKDRSVMIAARSLISVFREINPKMLIKKDRGKKSQMSLSSGDKKILNFGEEVVHKNFIGADLYKDYMAEQARKRALGMNSDDSIDEDEEDDEEIWVEDDENEDNNDDMKEMDDEELDNEGVTLEMKEIDEEDDEEMVMLGSDDDDSDDEQDAPPLVTADEAKEIKETIESEEKKNRPVSHIMSPEEFDKLEEYRLKRMMNPDSRSRKRQREEDLQYLEDELAMSVVEPDDIIGWRRKQKMTREERLAHMRENREKHGKPSKKSGGASMSNKEKEKKKIFSMVKDSRKVRDKQDPSLHLKQKNQRKHLKSLRKSKLNKRVRR